MDHAKKAEVALEVFPYARLYKDGTVERLVGTAVTPAGFDPETGVLSMDTEIIPGTGVSARLYRPNSAKPDQKIPLVVYFHGGGFFLSSVADPLYHCSLNKIVAEANIVIASVNYRLAPEYPLPAAYDDSWDALQWVAGLTKEGGGEEAAWLKDYADLGCLFLAGDSCGSNIAHHLAMRLKSCELGQKLNIRGIAMINPYFWGKDPIGVEITDHARKSMVDNWWMFISPSKKGLDDPFINPFVDGSPALDRLACDRVLVIVAEKDILRERGRLYYDKLVNSGWKGAAEIMDIKGEDHVFHIFNPNCENSKRLIKRLASYFNQPKLV